MPTARRLSRSIAITVLILTALQFANAGNREWGEAVAASAQTKQEFESIIHVLQALDSVYGSGNTAETQAKYDQAKSSWSKVAPTLSKKESREIQLLFDALGKQLAGKASAADVKSTVSDMLDELHEGIESLGK